MLRKACDGRDGSARSGQGIPSGAVLFYRHPSLEEPLQYIHSAAGGDQNVALQSRIAAGVARVSCLIKDYSSGKRVNLYLPFVAQVQDVENSMQSFVGSQAHGSYLLGSSARTQ